MIFRLEIDCDGDAFAEDGAAAVADLLRRIATRVTDVPIIINARKGARDINEAALETYRLTRDALDLAEQAPAYKNGEQWAVYAVQFLRRETARTLKNASEAGSR